MDYADFVRESNRVFNSIPEEYREGVDGIEVERTTVAHPSIEDVYTLGECKTETFPSEFGGAGVVQSIVVLYYGSFLALSRIDDEWDWDEEIFETITHEIRHHLESLASEESLEQLDYAEDQNFARREGESFDPYFYRLGTPLEKAAWSVDGDIFVEVQATEAEAAAGRVSLEWDGTSYEVPISASGEKVEFVHLSGADGDRGEIYAVVLRKRGLLGWILSLLDPRPGADANAASK